MRLKPIVFVVLFIFFLLLLFSKVNTTGQTAYQYRLQISQVDSGHPISVSLPFPATSGHSFRHFGRNRKLRNNFFILYPISNFLFEINS